eukprot:gene3455-3951_t
MDYCNGRQTSKSTSVQVQILSSIKVTTLGTAKALRAKYRRMHKKPRFGGELDFTNDIYLNSESMNFNCRSKCDWRLSKDAFVQFRLTQLLFGHDYRRILEKARHRWRCVADSFRYKKVRVICPDDGSLIRYRVKIINSCVCKEFKRQHNTGLNSDDVLQRQRELAKLAT